MDDILDIGYFRLAKNASKFSDHKIKIGAVIAKKKPICAVSNKCKTHPKSSGKCSHSTHAEIRALINCGVDDLNGTVIYVFRETKEGQPALARPCNMCYEKLKEKGIRKIFYTVPEYPYYKVEIL